MAGEGHLLLNWGGGYVDSANSTEVWQNSLRCVLNYGVIDPVAGLPTNWTPVPATINRTEADWDITGTWTLDGPGAAAFTPDDWLNDQVAPALDDWMSTSGISDELRLDWIKAFFIGDNGNAKPLPGYTQGTPCLLEWTDSNPTGDDGANLMPLQNAAVISHRTAQTGRKGRGRMYRAGVSTNSNDGVGRIGSTYVAFLGEAQVALLEAVALGDNSGGSINVRPAIIGDPWRAYGVINSVKVGNRMDTQRRRREQLDEAYVSSDVTY